MTCGNAWDSKNNIALTRILIKAGGKENEEFSNPMHLLLTKVRRAVAQVTHLNNAKKDEKTLVQKKKQTEPSIVSFLDFVIY